MDSKRNTGKKKNMIGFQKFMNLTAQKKCPPGFRFDEKLQKRETINKPVTNEIAHNIDNIFEFFKPEYLNVSNSLFLKSFIKNN